MMSSDSFYFGVVGEGPDATITAFASSVARKIPEAEQTAWACSTCTFWNTETMGRFCSMCGSRRFMESEGGNSSAFADDATVAANPSSHDESRDKIGKKSPFTFSPLPEENKKINSISDMLAMRGSSHHGSNTLEKSFSVFGLLGEGDEVDDFMVEPLSRKETKPALSARDFQMSFANWSISDKGAWACTACTFVNTNPLHLQCEICGQNRPAKNMQNHSQKAVQEMMENSFRTGQHDFLRKQQKKIEEIEDRVIAVERMKELAELQRQMLNELEVDRSERKDNAARSAAGIGLAQKAKLTEDFLDDLERARKLELEEQNRMGIALQERRGRLGMEWMNNETCLTPVNSQGIQIRAQEQLLSQWKQSYRTSESEVTEIRQRQEEIMNRWQHGTL